VYSTVETRQALVATEKTSVIQMTVASSSVILKMTLDEVHRIVKIVIVITVGKQF
jgi:hypothetical protein